MWKLIFSSLFATIRLGIGIWLVFVCFLHCYGIKASLWKEIGNCNIKPIITSLLNQAGPPLVWDNETNGVLDEKRIQLLWLLI